MASRGSLGHPGGPCLGFAAFLGNFVLMCFRCTVSKVHCLIFGRYVVYGAVTSCVMSQCHTCTGHMTFYYKRLASALFSALFGSSRFIRLLVHPSGSPLSPAYSWCLTHVGCDASSMSLDWSLLPSSIVIVLALVNSSVSPKGT